MGTITAQTVVNNVLFRLNDDTTSPVAWTKAELLGYLNSGQREIVKLKPSAWPVVYVLQCVEGTKQTVPSGGYQILDVIRNMGVGGSTPGKAVRPFSRKNMDEEYPNWHAYTASAVMDLWMFESETPKLFWNFPPQPSESPGQVEIVYSAAPTAVTVSDWDSGSDVITLDDVHEADLENWICHRARAKETEDAFNSAEAVAYHTAFLKGLGLQNKA